MFISVSAAKKTELLDLAEAKIKKALKIEPENVHTLVEFAQIYLFNEDKMQSNKAIEQAIGFYPNDKLFRTIKAQIEDSL
jgi:Tfp pilus assembly protein PilF